MTINTRIRHLVIAFVAITLVLPVSGCIRKRMIWSPDGQQAIMMTDEGTYVCDKDGTLLGSSSLVTKEGTVWFHDSKRLLVHWGQEVTTWEEAKAGLSEQRQKELMALAQPLREEILSHEGTWNGWKPKLLSQITGEELVALWLYVRDHHSEGLQDKIGDKWNEWRDLKLELHFLQIYTVSQGRLEAGVILLKSVNEVFTSCLSREDKKLACVMRTEERGIGESPGGRLMVADIAHFNGFRGVADRVARYPDWSMDGRSLVYAKAEGWASDKNSVRLGSIISRTLCGEDGRLLDEFGEERVLAGILFPEWATVRCLRNGRILFSTVSLQLPCTAKDMPQRSSLFAVHPDWQATVTRLLTHEAEIHAPNEGLRLGAFELSPDERRVTLVDWEEERVAIYELATGTIKELVPLAPSGGEKLLFMPTWRTADELCFAARPGRQGNTSKRAEIMLYSVSADKTRCISSTWPDELLRSVFK